MSSSKQPTTTRQEVTQTNLPAYLEPFVTRIAGRAEEQSNRPYEAYTGPRISDFNADQNTAFNQTRGLAGTYQPQMDMAAGTINSAAQTVRGGLAGANPIEYNAQRTFGNEQAQQYMNPFIQGVMDRTRSSALQTLQEQRARANADFANSAPFGSYGDIVNKSILERDFGNRVADQDANLLMQGYTNAQQQFNADRGFGQGQDEATNRTMFERANLGLRGAELMGNLGGQQAQLASQQRGLAAADIDAMQRIGLQQQQQRQSSLDLAYQDFVNQRDYGDNRLQFMSNIVRGLPSQMGSDTTSYAPPANPYSQLLGLGQNAIGIANALGGRTG
jgi:hypothetical protein